MCQMWRACRARIQEVVKSCLAIVLTTVQFAIQASASQVNRQIVRPNSPCFVLIVPHFTLSFYFTCENPSEGYRHELYEQLCTTGCQTCFVHFCWPSDLLSTSTTCFSKLIAYKLRCSSCGQNLIQFATDCCPTASTVCATCTFAEP
jgi:hypothetical protein